MFSGATQKSNGWFLCRCGKSCKNMLLHFVNMITAQIDKCRWTFLQHVLFANCTVFSWKDEAADAWLCICNYHWSHSVAVHPVQHVSWTFWLFDRATVLVEQRQQHYRLHYHCLAHSNALKKFVLEVKVLHMFLFNYMLCWHFHMEMTVLLKYTN